jgi:hypothetical protein
MLALFRSLLHMAWMVVTVVPWTLAVLGVSLFSRRAAWWTAVNWFSVRMPVSPASTSVVTPWKTPMESTSLNPIDP